MKRLAQKRLRLLYWIVTAYLLLALGWWSVLLFVKNRDAFLAKAELLKIGMVAEGLVHTDEEFLQTPQYQTLEKQYRHQEVMIFGEGLFFMITLLIGIWMINRGYNDVLRTARQQRNFLLSITHELKSPLASIRLVLETLQRRPLPHERQQPLLAQALTETDRLNDLVNNLLLSARLDTSWQPVLVPCDVAGIAARLTDELQQRHPDRVITLDTPEALPVIRTDCDALEIALRNLIENALKYAPAPSPVEVVIATEEGKHLLIEVRDHGPGVPDKEKDRIFEKFYRVGNEDTRTAKGTGLGLYIVHQIVTAHGGTIEVRDNQPRGARFIIKLPIRPGPISQTK